MDNKNNNNKLLEVAVGGMAITIVGLVFMLVVLTITLEARAPAKVFPLLVVPEIWQAAYGQQQLQQQRPTDVKVIESDVIRKNISDAFFFGSNSGGAKLKDYTLYENGTGEFVFEVKVHPFVTGPASDKNTTTMTVTMDHRWGAERGYIYNSTGVYTPDGSQRLIIATID